MDLPPPVQDPQRREDADDPAVRLAAVEAELISLGARMEQLEASLQQAVRDETRRASNEIRHTVSELGRRLALDLPQFLDRHRQLIVGELRGGGPATAGTAASSTGTAGGAAGESATGDDGTANPTAPVDAGAGADSDDDTASDAAGGGRRKRRRRKEG